MLSSINFIKYFSRCFYNNSMKYDPKQVMVLGAIQGGAKKFDKVRKITNLDPEELNSILEELEKEGLIGVEEKKSFFGKKIEINNTEKGIKELENSINEMESKWGEMKTLYQLQDKKKLEGFMDNNRSFFPMMMFFGIMDMMMFSMMFSMIGSTMGSYVPAEDMPAGTEDSGAAAETGQDYSDPGMDDGGFDFDFGF